MRGVLLGQKFKEWRGNQYKVFIGDGKMGVEHTRDEVDSTYKGKAWKRLADGHNGVNNFPSDKFKGYVIFTTTRDPIELYCSKFSMELRDIGTTQYVSSLDTHFADFIKAGTDYNFYKENPSWPKKTQFETWDLFPDEILKFNCGWFSSMLIYQTCLIDNDFGVDIASYDCPIKYWSDANQIDNLLRLDRLSEDYKSLGLGRGRFPHANRSKLTNPFLETISDEMKELIREKEELFLLVHEGKLDHKLRRGRKKK